MMLINSCDRLLAHRATVALNCASKIPLIDHNHGSPSGFKRCRTSTVDTGAVVRMGYAPQKWEVPRMRFWYLGRGALAGDRLWAGMGPYRLNKAQCSGVPTDHVRSDAQCATQNHELVSTALCKDYLVSPRRSASHARNWTRRGGCRDYD